MVIGNSDQTTRCALREAAPDRPVVDLVAAFPPGSLGAPHLSLVW